MPPERKPRSLEKVTILETAGRLKSIFEEEQGDRPQEYLHISLSRYNRRRVRGILPDFNRSVNKIGKKYVGIVEDIYDGVVSYRIEEHLPDTVSKTTRIWEFNPNEEKIICSTILTEKGRTRTGERKDVTCEPAGNDFVNLVAEIQWARVNYSGLEDKDHTFILPDLQNLPQKSIDPESY